MAALIEKGDVSVEYKHLIVLGARSQWAAEANECAADQGKFWAYHDLLFTKSGKTNFTVEALKGWAKDLGLDTAAFNQCFDSKKHTAAIQNNAKEAQALKINSTPTYVMNGKVLKNTTPDFSDIVNAVKEAVKK